MPTNTQLRTNPKDLQLCEEVGVLHSLLCGRSTKRKPGERKNKKANSCHVVESECKLSSREKANDSHNSVAIVDGWSKGGEPGGMSPSVV